MNKQQSKYRWVVFGVLLLAYLFMVSQRTAPGLITDQLMEEFHLTAATIGLITSIQFFAYAGLQIPIGLFSDRFGPNVFLVAGTLLNGLGTILYSSVDNSYMLIFARLLCGIGDATIWVNLVLVLSIWFKQQEFSMLVGFAGMTGSLGFLLATVPFSSTISLLGWRLPFLIVGIVIFTLGMGLYVVLIKYPKKKFQMEEEKNQKETNEPLLVIISRLLVNRQAWATFLCHFGVVGTYIGFIGSWAVPYGMDIYGLSRSSASEVIMYGLFGAIIGAPLTTYLSTFFDRVKLPYVIVQMLSVSAWITLVLMGGEPPYLLFIFLFVIIGYANGASALTFTVVRQSFHIKEVGLISGFANTGGFLSAVLLPAIFGKVLDHFANFDVTTAYQYGLYIPLSFAIIGLIGVFMLYEPTVYRQKLQMSQIKKSVG